jgi:NADH:ubiquinone oxidoreductase subunit 5 (subunit L)/multisubunit Na+/H+ antiporter MnhA subunit
MHHEQDIRRMGGLARVIPVTYAMMLIGTLSLTGFPLTAGFFSKDAIIEAAFVGHNVAASYAFWLTVITAALTSFYSWRLIFLTFHGSSRADHHTLEHAHESPPVMTVPAFSLSAPSSPALPPRTFSRARPGSRNSSATRSSPPPATASSRRCITCPCGWWWCRRR